MGKNSGNQLLLLSALLMLLIIILMDLFFINPGKAPTNIGQGIMIVFEEGHPQFNLIQLLRTGGIGLSALLSVLYILSYSSVNDFIHKIEKETFSGWGKLHWISDSSPGNHLFSIEVKKLLLIGLILILTFFLFLFYDRPGYFSKLSLEDGPIENLSAVFYFFASLAFCSTFYISYRQYLKKNKLALLISFALASGFFVLGMEEVSWFQRVLSIESPEFFLEHNAQKELNIHNFFMEPIYISVYYFGCFAFLFLLPFLYERFHYALKNDTIKLFIPGRFIIFISAIIMAYNYDMWNIFIFQYCFFVSLFVLAYYLHLYYKKKEGIFLLSALFIVFTLTQLIFLAYGEQKFVREWEVTEYKELLIPFAFFIYSIEAYRRVLEYNSVSIVNPVDKKAAIQTH